MNRVGIYLRVSTEEQARIVDGSLVSQKSRLEEYVAGQNRRDNGWGSIIDIYCDEAKSGKNLNRPEFQRLLEDVRMGRVNLVLATELSRLSRSIRDFCELWDLFKKHDAKVITLREQFDTTTAAGEMMVFNLINFAQFERKQTGERISANFLSRAKRGLWNGGRMPLGYDRHPENKGMLVPNSKETELVKTIFRKFLETGSVRETCLVLNKLGLRTKSGNFFTVSGLYNVLINQSYIGKREIGKKAGKLELVSASWPAIVDADIFEKVQAILVDNKNRYKPEEWKTYPYPLTEKIICGECGKKMGGKSAHGSNRRHHYYEHPRKLAKDGVTHSRRCRLERVRAERTETMVLGFLKTILANPGMIAEMVSAYHKQTNQELPGLRGRLKAIETELKDCERKVANLVARLSELPTDISAEPIYVQLKQLNEEIGFLKETQVQLEAQTQRVTAGAVDEGQLIERITAAVAALETAPATKQRAIFNNVIQFAELHPTKVRLGIYAPLATLARSTSVLNGGGGET